MGEMILNRRKFLVSSSVVAGGMALAIAPARAARPEAADGPWGPQDAQGNELTPWIEIASDDTVTIRSPNPESGNGTMTQMAMNIAEELHCDWSKVKVKTASINRDWVEDRVYTTKKASLPFFSGHATDKERMRHTMQLGASARERLKAAAAAQWAVPIGDIDAVDSVLTHRSTGRTLRYGEVAAAAAQIKLAAEPDLKSPKDWTLIGKKSPPKLFNSQVANGSATYGIDIKLPGMVHAALKQVPVMGGKLKSVDASAVMGMPGVRKVVILDPANSRKSPVKEETSYGLLGVTEVQHGVAVIADHYWQAKQALDALPVEWDLGPGADIASADEIYDAMRNVRDSGVGKVVKERGDVTAATGSRIVEAEYLTPYAENAAMEPLGGTALVIADAAELWCATQDTRQAFWVAVDETGYAPGNVQIHAAYVGGNFGRRTQADDLRMVVAIARQYPGVPVKTIWSREECFAQGRYRTPISTKFKTVLDDETGLPEAISGDLVFAGDRPLFHLKQGFADTPFYETGIVPHVRLTTASHPVHVLNGAYRAPCFNSSAFMTETMIDECAASAGIDPLEYRLKLVEGWDESWRKALKLVAAKSGWGEEFPKGEGLGIAISSWPMVIRNFGTVVAAAARVAVTKKGQLNVRRLDIAFDCGSVANEDAVRAQIEGAAIYGLNFTLNEEMTLENGAMVESNFDSYPMLRMADMPEIHVHFGALSGQPRFDIVGESPVGPIGPAIGNAIYSATGKRLRSTPFRKHDLSWS